MSRVFTRTDGRWIEALAFWERVDGTWKPISRERAVRLAIMQNYRTRRAMRKGRRWIKGRLRRARQKLGLGR